MIKKAIEKNAVFIVLAIYFLVQLFLSVDYVSISDEGTHILIGFFYKDAIKNIGNFHSVNDFLNFATDYVVKYPKITSHYPPLYHLLITTILFFTSNELVLRSFNIIVTISTALVTYFIALEVLKSKNQALTSVIFFLSFFTIFYYSNKIMMDVFAAFIFSLTMLYYIKLRKKIKRRDINKKEIFTLSFLLILSLLTKFQSAPLPIIILIDSFFYNKKLMYKCFLALIIAGLVISPYAYLYINHKLYKLALSIATGQENRLEYINFFYLFGIFTGAYVVISTVLFFWKKADKLIYLWFFVSLGFLFLFSNAYARFSFIVFPVYAIACGYFFSLIKNLKYGKIIVVIIALLIILQFGQNFYFNFGEKVYPVKDLLRSIKNDGNVLILSERPVHSSIYILYGRINNLDVNFLRPCILNKSMNYGFLEEWSVKYVIDQEKTINENLSKELSLNEVFNKNEFGYTFRIWETNVTNKVDCNFICILNGKVCKGQGFSRIKELISEYGH